MQCGRRGDGVAGSMIVHCRSGASHEVYDFLVLEMLMKNGLRFGGIELVDRGCEVVVTTPLLYCRALSPTHN